ncbi:MAG: glycosyltransferase family 39 protein [Acidobacteriia bacterium]|nr:glycosyltransferase family 39 protein [Terriglobia bacterium]
MEAGIGARRPPRWGLLLLIGVVLLIRLPFLNQAVQGDDDTYITEAEHALIEPLHPTHTLYVFQGVPVDLRGHPHPPLDAWTLAALLGIFGDVREIPFHAAYIGFSLIAVLAMWSLAKRFSPEPIWASLLFVAVPTFVVNGNSFESDLPFLAFWMAAIALFCAGRLWLAAAAMALAALAAYQAVFLTPILAVYVWLYHRRDRLRWAAVLTPIAVVFAWQVFERLSTGALPAAVLTGYFNSYGLQTFTIKLRNAIALAIHFCWILFPLLLPPALVHAWRKRRDPQIAFVSAWIAIFFAGAVAVFFAGSARYLLPIAAPLVLLASRLRTRWLAAGFAAQLALGLALAIVNYQHWDGYRQFARNLEDPSAAHRVWVNGELGLRFYLEAGHALPLQKTQTLRTGDIVATSELTQPITPATPLATIARMDIRPAIPLRLIGLQSEAGYSDASRGLWPFGVSASVIDRVHAELVTERHPTREYLPMNAPEAAEQIVSGIYSLEGGGYRWTGRSARVILKSPAAAAKVAVNFTIPAAARARQVTVLLDGRQVASKSYAAPGTYTIESAPVRAAGATADIEVQVDQTFTAPPDTRELGIVLAALGFVP